MLRHRGQQPMSFAQARGTCATTLSAVACADQTVQDKKIQEGYSWTYMNFLVHTFYLWTHTCLCVCGHAGQIQTASVKEVVEAKHASV